MLHRPSTVKNSQEDSDEVYALKQRVRELERLRGLHWRPPLVLRLTNTQSKILGYLMTKPVIHSPEMIRAALYSERIDPPCDEVLRSHVRNLRRILDPRGVRIHSRYGVGYFITPDDMAKINALYEPHERTAP